MRYKTLTEKLYEGNVIPVHAHYSPKTFRAVEAPRFQDNRHTKVVRLPGLGTGRLNPPDNIPGTHFC